MDEENLELNILSLILVISFLILLTLAILTIKWRDTSDKVDRIAEQLKTEQTLEQPTTQITTEVQIEPGDDEIVIDRGLSNE